MKNRCSWAGDDALYVRYHDREWGVPVYSDRKLFEMLILVNIEGVKSNRLFLDFLF